MASSAAEALAEAEQLEQRFPQLQQRIDAAMQVRPPGQHAWSKQLLVGWLDRVGPLAHVHVPLLGGLHARRCGH